MILCKHVKYVSFRKEEKKNKKKKHGHIINTGNIGIHKLQKKKRSWSV